MTERLAFLVGVPVGVGAFLYALVAPAFRRAAVHPVGEPRRDRLPPPDLFMNSPKALAWHCPRCLVLVVRLDTDKPPKVCDRCGGGGLRPFPLRDKPEAP